jgi:DNA-binding CsgD family transcriptional regulator
LDIRRLPEAEMTEDGAPEGFDRPLVVLLVLIAVGGAVDLALDAPTDWWSVHVVYEVLLIAGALTTAGWLWRRWRGAERTAGRLEAEVAERQAERDLWRRNAEEALGGLAVAIDRQLEAWSLTPAERDVVVALLKGRSHKEIAAATGRSERTVRQHAVAAYEKAGLGGRAELAAYFLRDLPLAGRGAVGGHRER